MKAEIVQPCQNSNVKAVPAETNKMHSCIKDIYSGKDSVKIDISRGYRVVSIYPSCC